MRKNRNSSERFRGDYVFAPEYASNLYAPVDAEVHNLMPVQPKYRNAEADEFSWFVFHTISFGDRLQVLGGFRRTILDQRQFDASGMLTQRYDRGATTLSAAVVFKPHANLATYLSYAEGLEQGGIAPASADNAGETFAPLESEMRPRRCFAIGFHLRGFRQAIWSTKGIRKWTNLPFTVEKPQ